MAGTGNHHSIHFPDARLASPDPPPALPKRIGKAKRSVERPAAGAAQAVNQLELYANALRDAETVRNMLRGLVVSGTRHGDLHVARSASLRIAESLKHMIDAEENQ